MRPTSPLLLLVPILLFATATPTKAQIPAAVDLPLPVRSADGEWRQLSASTIAHLAASIVAVEAMVTESRDAGALNRMSCHNTKLAELRGLRRAAVDSTARLRRALDDGHRPLVATHWSRLLATRAHGPLLFDEALTCGDLRREDLRQVLVVRVSAPAWDEDVGLGDAPVTHGR